MLRSRYGFDRRSRQSTIERRRDRRRPRGSAGSARRRGARRRRRRRGRPRDRCESCRSHRHARMESPMRGRRPAAPIRVTRANPTGSTETEFPRAAARRELPLEAARMSAPHAALATTRDCERSSAMSRARSRVLSALSVPAGPRGVPERCRGHSPQLLALAADGRFCEGVAEVVAAAIPREIERGTKARLVSQRQRSNERLEHRTRRCRPGPRHPEEEGRVSVGARPIRQPRDELEGRSSSRRRRGRRAADPGVGLGESPRDERPRRARARRTGHRAILGLFEGREVTRAHGHFGQDEPPTEVSLGPAKDRERGAHVLRDGQGPHERHEELDAHRDAVALFDHRRELRQETPRWIRHGRRARARRRRPGATADSQRP